MQRGSCLTLRADRHFLCLRLRFVVILCWSKGAMGLFGHVFSLSICSLFLSFENKRLLVMFICLILDWGEFSKLDD